MRTGIVITGLVIFLIALIISIVLLAIAAVTYETPDKDPYREVTGSGTVNLEKGDYILWIDEKDVEVTVRDELGKDIEINDVGMNVDYSENYLVGTISITKEGNYYISTETGTASIYVTKADDMQLQGILGVCGCCFGLFFIPAGLLALIIGLIMKKK